MICDLALFKHPHGYGYENWSAWSMISDWPMISTQKLVRGRRDLQPQTMRKAEASFAGFCLIVVVFSTVPAILSTLVSYLEDYCCWCQKYKAIVILFQQARANLLFLKFAFDSFVFGWRLRRRRQALKTIICFQLDRVRPRINTNLIPQAPMNTQFLEFLYWLRNF